MSRVNVSVIVPFYNCEKHVAPCIKYLMEQTLKNMEFILVNDGSTDNTGELLDAEAQRDKRIKVIHQQNGGPGSARHNGISAAIGEYIGFFDADDGLEPDMFDALYSLVAEKDADIAICGFYNIYNKENGLTKALDGGMEYLIVSSQGKNQNDDITSLILDGKVFSPLWNTIYKRQFLTEKNIEMPSNIRLHEDLVFNICVLKYAHKIAFVNRPLYHYFIGEASVSRRFYSDIFIENERIFTFFEGILATDLIPKGELFVFKRLVYSVRLCLYSGGLSDYEADLVCKGALGRLKKSVTDKIKATTLLKNSSGLTEILKNLLLFTLLKLGLTGALRAALKQI